MPTAPTGGPGFLGVFAAESMPVATPANALQQIYVYDSGSGTYMYSNGVQWMPMGGDELTVPQFRTGHLGSSTTERMNVFYGCDQTTYSRTHINGVGTATIRTNQPIDTLLNVGRRFRLTADDFPQIEGTFVLQSAVVEAGGHRVTWIDDRDDLAPSAIPVGTEIHYVDPQFYSCSSGVLSHMSMCSGGRIDPTIVATGGTNIIDGWSAPSSVPYNRVDQLLSQGPFGAITVGAGIFGDALLAGYGSDDIYAALLVLCRRLRGAAPRIYVETPTSSRNIIPSSNAHFDHGTMGGIYTAGTILLRRIWRDLVVDCPNVTIIPVNETLTTTVAGTYSGAATDVTNGWAPIDNVNSDGTHYAYGNARSLGTTWARVLNPQFLAWRSDTGAAPDNIYNAPFADPNGNLNPNVAASWYPGMPTVNPGTPVTGPMPQGCSVTVAQVSGSMSGTSSLVPNIEGGTDWILTFADSGNGSTNGEIVTLSDGGFTGQKYVDQLKAAPGKTLQIWVNPMIADFLDNSVKAWDCKLMLDYGAGLTPHVGAADLGLYRQGAIGRAMNDGFDGPLRFPTTTVPLDAAGLVDAQIQFVWYGVGNSSVGTNMTFGLRAGARMDIY